MTIPSYNSLYCTRFGAPRFLQWCDPSEVRRGLRWNDPELATDWIEVKHDVFVNIEGRSVCEHDWEGDDYRPLTAADVKEFGLEDEFFPYDYDDEGELITDWTLPK